MGKGSHKVFTHPLWNGRLTMQSVKGKAKSYQVRQALKAIERLTMSKMEYPVTIFYSEEDGGYIAVAPDLKGAPLSVRPRRKL